MSPRLHAVASAGVAGLALPSARDLGFVASRRTRRIEARLSDKTRCMWRAAQSGKTRKIMEMIRDDPELSAGFHVVICANIRLQVEQLTSRMKRDLYYLPDESSSESGSDSDTMSADSLSVSSDEPDGDDKIEGGVCTWLSGSNAKTKMTKGELANEIKEGNVSMVVCCSHKTRFKHLILLLEDLEKSKLFNKRITIWVDEADASVKLWSTPELDLTRFAKVDRMNLVSATFNSIVHKYGRIRVIGYPDLHPECYMPLKECNLVVQPMGASAVDTLAAVLSAHPEMCRPGVRLFAPALVARNTHDGVADYLQSKGFAVMVLNGERKCIVCPDGRVIPIVLNISGVDPDEIATVLPRLYADNDLAQWPFAVTGQMCLGRGITFQSGLTYGPHCDGAGVRMNSLGFMFDYGVLPDLPEPASAYQCVARLLGNVKQFDGFKAPTVFMSEKMKQWTLAEEQIAIHIAAEVNARGWADVGEEEIDLVLTGDEEKFRTPPLPEVSYSGAFETPLLAKAWAESSLTHRASAMYPCTVGGGKDGDLTHFKYRGKTRAIASLADTLTSGDLAWGQGSWDKEKKAPKDTGCPRVMPVLEDGAVRFIVVFKPFYLPEEAAKLTSIE
jgi:hypothetical protein